MRGLACAVIFILVAAAGCADSNQPDVISPETSSVRPPIQGSGDVALWSRDVSGVTVVTWEVWLGRGGSLCASPASEAPYLGPPVFGVADDQIPAIALPQDRRLLDARMCNAGDMVAINYIMEPDLHILLVESPPEWPVHVPLDELTEARVHDKAAVVAQTPSGQGGIGPMLIVPTPFGLLVVFGDDTTEDETIKIAEAIDLNAVQIPEADPIFVGVLNGINFYDGTGDVPECKYGQYGLLGGSHGRPYPMDGRLAANPSYLPAGTEQLRTDVIICDNMESVETTYQLGRDPESQYWIVRTSGEAEWFSVYSRGWFSESSVAGLPAVVIASPGLRTDAGPQLHVREAFGLTTIYGPDRDELIRIAEGLNR